MWRIHVPLPLAFSHYHLPLTTIRDAVLSYKDLCSGSTFGSHAHRKELANLVTYHYSSILLLTQEIGFKRQKMSLHLETCPLNPPLVLNSGSLHHQCVTLNLFCSQCDSRVLHGPGCTARANLPLISMTLGLWDIFLLKC